MVLTVYFFLCRLLQFSFKSVSSFEKFKTGRTLRRKIVLTPRSSTFLFSFLFNWREAYQLAAKYTKSTRIIEFQYKFLHRRISTNDFLTKIGVKDNPNCCFCNNEPEKLLHLFWSCPKVAFFWHSLSLKLTLLHITPEHYTLDIFVALGLKPDSSKNCQQINFLFLLARNYIWISKRRETSPKIAGFLQYLKSLYHIETTAGPILLKKWENVSSLFQ